MAKKKYLDKDGAQRVVDKTLGLVSPQNLLAGLKTVDGAGSGLDADTLDGVQGARFLRTVGRSSEQIDLSTYTENVFRELRPSEQETLNCPIAAGAYGGVLTMVSADNIAAFQIAFDSSNHFFIRARHGYNKPFSNAWRELVFRSDVAALESRIAALEAQLGISEAKSGVEQLGPEVVPMLEELTVEAVDDTPGADSYTDAEAELERQTEELLDGVLGQSDE